MTRSEKSAKLEMRILRFMQLPFVVALVINMVMVVRVSLQEKEIRADGLPAAGPTECAEPSDESVPEEVAPAGDPREADPPEDIASSDQSRELQPEDRVTKGGTAASRAEATHRGTEPLPRALKRRPIIANVASNVEHARAGSSSARERESGLRLICPATHGSDIHYVVNNEDRVLRPGQSEHFLGRDLWIIQFHRGGEFGDAKYVLAAGSYTFTAGRRGWQLVKTTANKPARS